MGSGSAARNVLCPPFARGGKIGLFAQRGEKKLFAIHTSILKPIIVEIHPTMPFETAAPANALAAYLCRRDIFVLRCRRFGCCDERWLSIEEGNI